MSDSPETDWYAIDAAEALQRLASSADGLSDDEASRRLREHGRNVLRRGTADTWLPCFSGSSRIS